MTFCEMFIFHDFSRPGFFFHFLWFSMIFHDSGNPVKALRVLRHVQIGQEITCSEAKEGQLQQSSAQRAGGGAGAVFKAACLESHGFELFSGLSSFKERKSFFRSPVKIQYCGEPP